ncbi:hypothetical protein CCANI_02605 [Corynebacterium canis]|nr:hypothetical protein CCANI_02605 [Corynebacterium canis]
MWGPSGAGYVHAKTPHIKVRGLGAVCDYFKPSMMALKVSEGRITAVVFSSQGL